MEAGRTRLMTHCPALHSPFSSTCCSRKARRVLLPFIQQPHCERLPPHTKKKTKARLCRRAACRFCGVRISTPCSHPPLLSAFVSLLSCLSIHAPRHATHSSTVGANALLLTPGLVRYLPNRSSRSTCATPRPRPATHPYVNKPSASANRTEVVSGDFCHGFVSFYTYAPWGVRAGGRTEST